MTNNKTSSRLTKALLETADDMRRRIAILDAAVTRKSRCAILGGKADIIAKPISGDEIRSLRECAHVSQAFFAQYLNLTTGYISQLETGAKQPTGPRLCC